MEQANAGLTAPVETATKKSALATWSLILGIVGVILCFILVPGLLAIIFGIVALVQINNSKGQLTGKGKAIAGIILGGVSFILIPVASIIAAILIPNLLSSRIAANETSAAARLKVLFSCEMQWRRADYDHNQQQDYWTKDISAFYRMKDSNGNSIALIDQALACADDAPIDNDALGKDILLPLGKKQPKNGYLFRAMLKNENGLYNQGDVNGVPATNLQSFAFVAYPAQYGSNGVKTFIVNEAGTIYEMDTGSDDKKVILEWPGPDPTAVEGPVPSRTWRVIN